jgi:hypothetical protein
MLVWQMMILTFALVAGAAGVPDNQPDNEGNFRAASISWMAISGNTVDIHLQSEWTRSYSGYTQASTGNFILGPTQAVIGDVVRISGRVPPRLFFGDGQFANIDVRVTSYSSADDWFRGNTTLRHTYSSPGWTDSWNLNGGWEVKVSGCCRIGQVLNNAGSSWSISTVLDLQRRSQLPALASPLVGSVSSYFNFLSKALDETCALEGDGQGQKGVCMKFEFSNRDSCPAHVFLSDDEAPGNGCLDLQDFSDSKGDSCAVWSANPTWCSGLASTKVQILPQLLIHKHKH